MFYLDYNIWVVWFNCWYLVYFRVIFINCKKWYLFCRYIDRYIVYKLCYRKIFNPVILVIIDIIFKILFNNLIESFYLFIGLKIKNCRKLIVYSEFYYKRYKKP